MTESTVTTRAITPQLRENGRLRHLLTLAGLDTSMITHLLERSQSFVRELGEPPPASRDLAGITVANLFTEPSTRTRVSFELQQDSDRVAAVHLAVLGTAESVG